MYVNIISSEIGPPKKFKILFVVIAAKALHSSLQYNLTTTSKTKKLA